MTIVTDRQGKKTPGHYRMLCLAMNGACLTSEQEAKGWGEEKKEVDPSLTVTHGGIITWLT
jgi:hypothetical protein